MNKSTTSGDGFPRRFPIGWRARHGLVLVLAGLGAYAFLESRAEWSDMHRWNRALADVSLVLVSIAMAIGPLARLWRGFGAAIAWRRELGIYGVVLAAVHTAIILEGWVEWDFFRLFGYELHPQTGQYVMLQHGFALANVIGIAALAYGVVLALVSNNWSQRRLGGAAWKFLQQAVYVLWMLILLHTAYFLYLHFQDFHRQVPEPNWAQAPFAVLVVTVAALQLAAFIKTWRTRRRPRWRPGRGEPGTAAVVDGRADAA